MTTLILPGGTVTLFDSSRKLPESRRVECDYYSLVDAAIGSTIHDIDRHFMPLSMLIGSTDLQGQLDALNNLRYLFYNLLHKQMSPRSLALACLVDEVNGQKWTDYTPEGLELLISGLSDLGLSNEHVEEYLFSVKKKSFTA